MPRALDACVWCGAAPSDPDELMPDGGEGLICRHCRGVLWAGVSCAPDCLSCRRLEGRTRKPRRRKTLPASLPLPRPVRSRKPRTVSPAEPQPRSWSNVYTTGWSQFPMKSGYYSSVCGIDRQGAHYAVMVRSLDPESEGEREVEEGKRLLNLFLSCSCQPGQPCDAHANELAFSGLKGQYV